MKKMNGLLHFDFESTRATYAFYDTKLSINMEFEMEGEAEVKQLNFSKTCLRETMNLRSKTRSEESLWVII